MGDAAVVGQPALAREETNIGDEAMSENESLASGGLSLVLEVSEGGDPTSGTPPALYSVQGLPAGMLVHIRQQGVDWHMVSVGSHGEMSMGLYDTPDHALRALQAVL